jgi:hypothetical protein
LKKKDLLHSRNIIVNCFEVDENTLLVEGSLSDERLFPSIVYTANIRRDPGIVHNMSVSMYLSIPGLKINKIKADITASPIQGCSEIVTKLNKLEGLIVKAGFTNEVRKILGKAEGCIHLTNLILAMSSAAVQGLWAFFSRIRENGQPLLPGTDPAMIIDSCWMWRDGGPMSTRFMEIRKAKDLK